MLGEPIQGGVGEGTEASPRLVVEVWLAVPAPDGWRVLLLKRSDVRGGFWQGVSGRVETTDASLEAAARRELREEIGLEEPVEILDLGRWIDFRGFVSGRHFRKRSLGAVLPPDTDPVRLTLSDEHVEARLVTFDEARALVGFAPNVDELAAFHERLLARVRST